MQGATSIVFGSSFDLDDRADSRTETIRDVFDTSQFLTSPPLVSISRWKTDGLVEFVRTGEQPSINSFPWNGSVDPTQTVITGDDSLAIDHARARIELKVDQTPVEESVTADVALKVWAAIREMSLRDQITLSRCQWRAARHSI